MMRSADTFSRRSFLVLLNSLASGAIVGCGTGPEGGVSEGGEPGGEDPSLRFFLSGKALSEVDGALQPLAGARVTLHTARDAEAQFSLQTAADGSFEFDVPTGLYLLKFSAEGFRGLVSYPLAVIDQHREGLQFVLQPLDLSGTFSVGGIVRDEDGPASGVQVVLSRQSEGSNPTVPNWQLRCAAGSGPDGSFSFVALSPGTYKLDLVKVGYHPASIAPFVLEADRDDFDVTLARDIIDTFRFAIHSDMHIRKSGTIPTGLKACIRGTLEYAQPSFVLFTGDMTSGTTSGPTDQATANYYWDSFFAAIAGLVPSHIHYFPVRGNHDYYTQAQQTVYHQRWENLQVPGVVLAGDPAAYYSFDFGNSHFTVLAGHKTSLGTAQMDWLQQDLQAAQGAAHRFVFSHIPLVAKVLNGSGGIGYGTISGTTTGGDSLEQVLADGNIVALIVGHEHVYVDDPAAAPGVRQVTCATAAGTYNFKFIDGTKQQLVPSMVVVDVAGDQVDIFGVRDEPEFCTTWEGNPIGPPPPRLLGGQVPPLADILVVDGWQRGRLDERETLRSHGEAMFQGFVGHGGEPLSVAVVDQASIASGLIDVAGYRVAVYLLSNESSSDLPFTVREQQLLEAFVRTGGKLIVSGSEIGYEMASSVGGVDFYERILLADYLSDDAGTGAVVGVSGTPFSGVSASFDQGSDPWRFPDVIAPATGAQLLMEYGSGQGAAIGWQGAGSVIYFAFAIDALDTPNGRRAVAQAALRFQGVIV